MVCGPQPLRDSPAGRGSLLSLVPNPETHLAGGQRHLRRSQQVGKSCSALNSFHSCSLHYYSGGQKPYRCYANVSIRLHLSMSPKSHVLAELKGPRHCPDQNLPLSRWECGHPRGLATSLALQPWNSYPGCTVLGWAPALTCVLLAWLAFCMSFLCELKYLSSRGSFFDPSHRFPHKLCSVPAFLTL